MRHSRNKNKSIRCWACMTGHLIASKKEVFECCRLQKNFSKFCSYEERKNKNWFHIPVLCGKCLSQISPHELSPYYLLPTCFKVKIASKESEIAVSGMHVWLHTIRCQTSMKHWLRGYDGKTHQSLQMRTKFRLKFRHKVLT